MSDTPSIARDPLVSLLVAEWDSIDALLTDLADGDWSTITALPGWTVHDVVSHLIGTESMLAGEADPDVAIDAAAFPHVHNDIGMFNERWVEALRGESHDGVLDRFRRITRTRAGMLAAMSQDEFDAPSWTPAGSGTYGRFMQVRLFDCWVHEQDIRFAVGRPGHEAGACAEEALEEVVRALGYIVGKLGGAPDGSTVTFELTGPVHRSLHVAVDGRARVVDELDHPASATIRLGSLLFIQLAAGRVRAADHAAEVAVEGDVELGRHLVSHLAFTM